MFYKYEHLNSGILFYDLENKSGVLFCSDIRGVAVAGVEGEPVNLTEPVTEAIASAFAAWLLNKKKADGLRRLRISVGHDSRISANKLQVTFVVTSLVHFCFTFFFLSTYFIFAPQKH